MANLVLIRHGQSDWNVRNLFTGWENPDLTPLGCEQAIQAGQWLKDKNLSFDVAFSSVLVRAEKTLDLLLKTLGQENLPRYAHPALNERDYGELTGLDKAKACETFGKDQIALWRRSYDIPPPGGESLKDTLARVLPYYVAHIQPLVLSGKNVLVVAHGNSLRSLIMALEALAPEEITARELQTGVPVVYTIGSNGLPQGETPLFQKN